MENKTAEESRQNDEPSIQPTPAEGNEQAGEGFDASTDQQPEAQTSDFQAENPEEGDSAASEFNRTPEQESSAGSRPTAPSVYLAQRGARRGRRMSLRERRVASRHRGREIVPIQRPSQRIERQEDKGGMDEQPRERMERPERPERAERPERSENRMSPQKAASLREIRAHVERVRHTLEGVLRDLNRIAEQLTLAEREKDVAEQEIDNLKEQLRRLHR